MRGRMGWQIRWSDMLEFVRTYLGVWIGAVIPLSLFAMPLLAIVRGILPKRNGGEAEDKLRGG
jgi:hypothetical protein